MDQVPGYRIVRTLGAGSRASVQLAHPIDSTAPVALKMYAPAAVTAEIDREAAALGSIACEHVVALLDLCALAQVPAVLVLERLQTHSLSWLLRSRGRLSVGEAITVLVSIGRGVRAMHGAGYAHTDLGSARVLFGAGHRPVITGLGHVAELGGEHDRELRQRDWRRVTDIADSVFGRVDVLGREGDVAEVRAALAALSSGSARPADQDRFEDALFSLAPPAPVAVRAAAPAGDPQVAVSRAAGHSAGAALSEIGASDVRAAARASHGRSGSRPRRTEVPATDESMRAIAHGTETSTVARAARDVLFRMPARRAGSIVEHILENGASAVLRERLGPRLRRRRRPILLAAAVSAVLVLGAVLLLPSTGGQATARDGIAQPGSTETPIPRPSIAARPSTSERPAPSTSKRPVPAVTDDTDDPLQADDPVRAATALLAERSRCRRGADQACFSAVDEPSSPLAEADRTPDRAGMSAAEPDYSAYTVSLVETIGGSALVALAPPQGADAKPASALVVRGVAGWRLRQIYTN